MRDDADLILIDGSSFLYRAYYAAKGGFTTKSGIPTGVTLLMTNMLRRIISMAGKARIIAVFDAKGKSFRAELYKEYKANRPPMPDELKVQLEYVTALVKGLGLPFVSVTGVEADDVLGTYALKAEEKNLRTVICTGDKDLAQLVTDKTTLLDTMNDKSYDIEAVKEKYGVGPEHIIDLLALKGDASDNIPGMAGCGDKTACALINGLGGIEEIYARRAEISSLSFRGAKTFKEKYEAEINNIRLSYELARIRRNVELPLAIEDVQPPVADTQALLSLYETLEFRKLHDELMQRSLNSSILGADVNKVESKTEQKALYEAPDTFESLKTVSRLVLDIKTLNEELESAKNRGLVALDTETTSLRTEEASLVGISLCSKAGHTCYIPLSHDYLGVPNQLPREEVLERLDAVLNGNKVKIVGHNIKYDMLVLARHGLKLENVYADTMVMAHLLDSSQGVSMDELALSYLNYQDISYDEVTGKGKKRLVFSQVPLEQACKYAGEDAEVTFRLYDRLLPMLKAKPVLLKAFNEVEMPLVKVLFKMELQGVLVDRNVLFEQNKVLNAEILQIQQDIYASAGEQFNISSPKQLGTVLFEKLGIPYPKKRKEGASYSTAEDVLESIAADFDIANLVLRYRELSKLISTYTEKLPTLIDPKSGRIFTSFHPAGTVTGRLSSSDPNLQNIPARTHEGKLIRKAFIAPDGYTLISADYSQIELRLIAHIANDEGLIKAFNAGYDIHKATAAEVLGKKVDEVTSEERSRAKATNFGLMYGMGAFGLKKQTGMSMSEAKEYIELYFSRYPNVHKYMEKTKEFARKHGYVTTITGREIVIKNIGSTSQVAARGAERAAINAPMQGSAADLIKMAMIRIQNWIDSLPENTVRMTVQVHDELLFEVKNDFLDEAKNKIQEMMENVFKLKVPLKVGIGCAQNWGDAH